MKRVDANGRQTFIIAWCPLEKYTGMQHKVSGTEKMHKASTRGVHIVKELNKNTCEWTWVHQVNLKISMPVKVMDIGAKQELGKANVLQEKFRRNRKEVDREGIGALAEVMKKRRGLPPVEDQVRLFERCMTLSGEEDGEGWKALESPCPDVEMWLQYFPPERGERNVATGKAVGVVDSSAEEVAAWAFTFCSNESMRVHHEEGHPARLELRELARENESTIATVKRFPGLLRNREFVVRQVWRTEERKVLSPSSRLTTKLTMGRNLERSEHSLGEFTALSR